MKLIDKFICFFITKIEFKISKKENKVKDKNNISPRLQMYRDLLDRLDDYKIKLNKDLIIIRHYRYFTFKVDDIKE